MQLKFIIFRHNLTTKRSAFRRVIPAQAGIQLTRCVNLCHLALLHKFAFANWIPPFGGMTTWRNSPSFTAPAEKKGWIVSKANKTGQFSIIATTPDVRTFHNYPTTSWSPPCFARACRPVRHSWRFCFAKSTRSHKEGDARGRNPPRYAGMTKGILRKCMSRFVR